MAPLSDPERVIQAAKAAAIASRQLGLSEATAESWAKHDFEQHIKRIEAALEDERAENYALRTAVIRFARKTRIVFAAFIVLVVAVVLAGALLSDRTADLAAQNRKLGLANQRAQLRADADARRTAVQARRVIREACRSQNKDRGKLRAIILRGEQTIPKFVAEGTLSPEQAARALRDSRLARFELRNEDCGRRATKIPIPKAGL